jgi:hypothetical protein
VKTLPNFARIDDVLINFDLVARIEVQSASPQASAFAQFWSAENNLIFTWIPKGINKAAVIEALDRVLKLNTTDPVKL